MVSHELACIFIHIPKCGGTSIEAALGLHAAGLPKVMDHRTLRMLESPIPTAAFLAPEQWREIAKRLMVVIPGVRYSDLPRPTQAQYQNYFKFAIVRNPWARAYSWYRNVMRGSINRQRLKVQVEMDFEQFLELHVNSDALRPQTYWTRSYHGQSGLDFVGKFEELGAAFDHVCHELGLERRDLPHFRNSQEHHQSQNKNHYQSAFTDRAKGIIAREYAEEIEMFDYSFD